MLQHWVILLISSGYLGILFGIAYYGDKCADKGRSIISNPYIYTLSIAIYCTAWTFYGSVGRAASTGIGFLPIHIGGTLMAALWWFVLRKIIRIAKIHRVTSIADFLGCRYGKSPLLSGLVAIIAVIGIMPYIALQLKAISTSFEIIRHYPKIAMPTPGPFWTDTALYVALLLAIFTILFGTRHIDATERHEGMVAAIAFESLVKLIAFLGVGLFVTFGLFNGVNDLFTQAMADPDLKSIMTVGSDCEKSSSVCYTQWFSLTFISMMAIVFLPRQFHVLVVENVNEQHVRTASWLFPLYLFVINLFVLPIALGGHLRLHDMNPDIYVLTLPMTAQAETLALLVFIGGLSAATSMVIVEAIVLSTMVCNDLVMSILLRIKSLRLTERKNLSKLLLSVRRGIIILVLLLGYLYFRVVGESSALVDIGLVSFAAVTQFAPAILIGIYWKGASHTGALSGLIAGFLVWTYTLLLPNFAQAGWLPASFIETGLFNLSLLKPHALFGLADLDPMTHAVFWSMLANIGCLVSVSLFSRQTIIEQLQSTLFVDVFRNKAKGGEAYYWGGNISIEEIQALLGRFLGEARAQQAIEYYARSHLVDTQPQEATNPQLINFAERMLAGAIGTASAHIMVASTVKGETLSIEGVMQILSETTQVKEYSRRLEHKSLELEAATAELRAANERLKELDHLKDEFVSMVSHELRTPLTSIRAFSEILLSNPSIDTLQRQQFLEIIVKESERLTRLINKVLDLAKIESGRMEWHIVPCDLRELVHEACASVSQLFNERKVILEQVLPEQPALTEVDRDRFLQVFINLLSNACKFCEPASGLVIIRLLSTTEHLRIEVEDNGPGIATEHLRSVFSKFHQVSDQHRGKPTGTGLGLAICLRIVEHHGGRIWAENKLNSPGAIFVVTIPTVHSLNMLGQFYFVSLG